MEKDEAKIVNEEGIKAKKDFKPKKVVVEWPNI